MHELSILALYLIYKNIRVSSGNVIHDCCVKNATNTYSNYNNSQNKAIITTTTTTTTKSTTQAGFPHLLHHYDNPTFSTTKMALDSVVFLPVQDERRRAYLSCLEILDLFTLCLEHHLYHSRPNFVAFARRYYYCQPGGQLLRIHSPQDNLEQ